MDYFINKELLEKYKEYLIEAERSKATISKYLRDVRSFINFAGAGEKISISKEKVIEYKDYLGKHYELTSANSMLAALNSFLSYANLNDCRVKAFKIQRQLCQRSERTLSRSDYEKLLAEAKKKKQMWLYFLMMTICSTGIRVSEVQFITVESLCSRRARVRLKGKSRIVILPNELCKELRGYCKTKGIKSGSIFVTRGGKTIDRSNIAHAMKRLCIEAEVDQSRAFPHNLRHLFAVTHFDTHHDLPHLADILGHSNLDTTRIYTLISVEAQELQIEQLGLVV